MSLDKTASAHVEINAKMARVCPELSSPYAAYPLLITEWLGPSRTGSNGEIGFIQEVSRNAPSKPDYVHGPGPNGVGYYHLLTRDSYRILYNRLNNEAPDTGCFCSGSAQKNMVGVEDVKKILYNRSVATIPKEENIIGSGRGTEASSALSVAA